MIDDFWLFVAVGFFAQLVDGALGMAFGVLSTTTLLAFGVPPASASAVVHTAEIVTTGASAASHLWHRNVDWRLVSRLGVAGVAGAVLGAWVLSNLDAHTARPFVSAYLLVLGAVILARAARRAPVRDAPAGWTAPVGFVAAFLDASGGGGWGPVATSTLVGSGHSPRMAVGSVNATEFFVTIAAATTFWIELVEAPVGVLVALMCGGVVAAPLGGYMVRHVSPRPLMTAVGVLVIGLSATQLARFFAVF